MSKDEHEDLGDPLEDPDGDEENVKSTLDPDQVPRGTITGSPAPACKAALTQATARFPGRNRASDGILCDPNHPSKSDHCAGNAFDLTDDPAHGCNAHALGEQLKQRRDPRVKYIISNKRIWNPSISDEWRKYTGANPHNKHCHVSIKTSARNDTSPWWGDAEPGGLVQPEPEEQQVGSLCLVKHPLIKEGDQGEAVIHMQDLLMRNAHDLSQEGGQNGVFSAGLTAEVKAFQAARGLKDDGKVGKMTWNKLHEVVGQHV